MTGDRYDFDAWAPSGDGWDQETGAPDISYFGNAIQVWAIFQNRTVTVAEAALTFNCTPDRIRQAIKAHRYMYLRGDPAKPLEQKIEHDGE